MLVEYNFDYKNSSSLILLTSLLGVSVGLTEGEEDGCNNHIS